MHSQQLQSLKWIVYYSSIFSCYNFWARLLSIQQPSGKGFFQLQSKSEDPIFYQKVHKYWIQKMTYLNSILYFNSSFQYWPYSSQSKSHQNSCEYLCQYNFAIFGAFLPKEQLQCCIKQTNISERKSIPNYSYAWDCFQKYFRFQMSKCFFESNVRPKSEQNRKHATFTKRNSLIFPYFVLAHSLIYQILAQNISDNTINEQNGTNMSCGDKFTELIYSKHDWQRKVKWSFIIKAREYISDFILRRLRADCEISIGYSNWQKFVEQIPYQSRRYQYYWQPSFPFFVTNPIFYHLQQLDGFWLIQYYHFLLESFGEFFQ